MPSTHAPFRPRTTRTNISSSSSYSMRACSRETLFNGPKSTSIRGRWEDEAEDEGIGRRPIVTVGV